MTQVYSLISLEARSGPHWPGLAPSGGPGEPLLPCLPAPEGGHGLWLGPFPILRAPGGRWGLSTPHQADAAWLPPPSTLRPRDTHGALRIILDRRPPSSWLTTSLHSSEPQMPSATGSGGQGEDRSRTVFLSASCFQQASV